MRRLEESKYRVEISPAAWGHFGAVPRPVFQHVQDELELIARRVSMDEALRPGGVARTIGARFCVSLEGFVAVFEIDETQRVVTLTEVARGLAPRS
jgi:hypothetical protein